MEIRESQSIQARRKKTKEMRKTQNPNKEKRKKN
jgi:hypothetical protein